MKRNNDTYFLGRRQLYIREKRGGDEMKRHTPMDATLLTLKAQKKAVQKRLSKPKEDHTKWIKIKK